MAALLAATFLMGPLQMLKLYFVPYWVFVMWLDFVTYLHHHGHNDKLPWYRGKVTSLSLSLSLSLFPLVYLQGTI